MTKRQAWLHIARKFEKCRTIVNDVALSMYYYNLWIGCKFLRSGTVLSATREAAREDGNRAAWHDFNANAKEQKS